MLQYLARLSKCKTVVVYFYSTSVSITLKTDQESWNQLKLNINSGWSGNMR